MTRLLVSVRSEAEARLAAAADVDLIDIKEPSRGSLGAAAPSTIAGIARGVPRRIPTSAALGELTDPQLFRRLDRLRRLRLRLRLQFAKLGLAGCGRSPDWSARWARALALFPAGTIPVAVAYADFRTADAPHPLEVAQEGARLGCGGLLIDTYEKSCGGLFDILMPKSLRTILRQARVLGLFTVLAGSLQITDLPRALRLAPDLLAFRGALCRGSRSAAISPELLAELASQFRAETAPNRSRSLAIHRARTSSRALA